jgi:hypothetical protein
VAIGLLLVLILRPAGIMGGREFSWPRRMGTPADSAADVPVTVAPSFGEPRASK